jgi:hypothetical protein
LVKNKKRFYFGTLLLFVAKGFNKKWFYFGILLLFVAKSFNKKVKEEEDKRNTTNKTHKA